MLRLILIYPFTGQLRKPKFRKAQGLTKGWHPAERRICLVCGEMSRQSRAGLGTQESFCQPERRSQAHLQMPPESLVFTQKPRSAKKNPGKDSALGAFRGSWHLVDAHYSPLTQSAVDVLKEVGKAIFKNKEKQCCIH